MRNTSPPLLKTSQRSKRIYEILHCPPIKKSVAIGNHRIVWIYYQMENNRSIQSRKSKYSNYFCCYYRTNTNYVAINHNYYKNFISTVVKQDTSIKWLSLDTFKLVCKNCWFSLSLQGQWKFQRTLEKASMYPYIFIYGLICATVHILAWHPPKQNNRSCHKELSH